MTPSFPTRPSSDLCSARDGRPDQDAVRLVAETIKRKPALDRAETIAEGSGPDGQIQDALRPAIGQRGNRHVGIDTATRRKGAEIAVVHRVDLGVRLTAATDRKRVV